MKNNLGSEPFSSQHTKGKQAVLCVTVLTVVGLAPLPVKGGKGRGVVKK